MRKRLYTLLLACTLSTLAFSQTYFASEINEYLLKARVKQVEEFMARFNNEENWEGKKMNKETDSTYHAQYLRTLFDHNRFRKKNGKLTSLAEQFIHDVVQNHWKIHYSDTTWNAIVKCNVTIGGKHAMMELYLRTEQLAEHEYVWVISHVDYTLQKTDSTASRPFISPIEHEIGFTGLLSLPTDGKVDVNRLFPKTMRPDNLAVLAFLIKNGMIKITDIKDVRFSFFNVPGYAFTINRIENKGSYNTGWLITSLNIRTNN